METVRPDSKTIARVGLIGCGNIGSLWDENDTGKSSADAKTHAKAFSRHAGCQLVSLLDQSKERAQKAAQFWGVPHATDQIGEFLAQKLDIICLATPETARLSVLEKIPTQKGLILICEKPLGKTSEEVEKVVKLCQDRGWILLVNFVRTYGQGLREMRDLIQSGVLGSLVKIHGHYGKGLRNNGSHMLQALLQVAGTPKSGRSLQVVQDDRTASDDPTHDVQLMFNDQVSAYVTANDHRSYTVFEMDFFFTKGRIQVSDRGNKIEVYKAVHDTQYPGYQVLEKERPLSQGLGKHFENLVDEALRYFIHGGSNPQISSVLQTHAVIDQIQKKGTYGIL